MKIHKIALGSLLVKLIHNDFHLIYYIIETYTYKHLGGSVSFQCGIDMFSFFIHLQTTPTCMALV